jgi:hypothetical protein
MLRTILIVALVPCPLLVIGAANTVAVMQNADGSLAPRLIPTRGPSTEYTFARLIYAENPQFARNWGYGGYRWLTDAPEAETHLLQGIRRLTRIDTASEGTAVRLEDDAVFDYPILYAVEVGGWLLSDAEAARLREYLDRGGFLMVDDFHGTLEWEGFMESMRRVYPDRPVVEIPDSDEVWHVLYDLVDRPQIPGIAAVMSGQTYERDGYTPHWRGIYDEKGRLSVAINFNMDLGDAWEHADNPLYPQPYTATAYRIAINYLLYSMTH